jgi:hypothetical protein
LYCCTKHGDSIDNYFATCRTVKICVHIYDLHVKKFKKILIISGKNAIPKKEKKGKS